MCRFSGAKMRQIAAFARCLDFVIAGQDVPDEREDVGYCPKCGRPYPERGRSVCPKCMERKAIFIRILMHFKNYRLRIGVLLLCMVLSGLLSSAIPYLTGTVLYDKVLARDIEFSQSFGISGDFAAMLLLLVICSAFVQLVHQIVGVVQGRMTAYIVPGVVAGIKTRVFAALQKLSIGFL